jgi:hypothetical protein
MNQKFGAARHDTEHISSCDSMPDFYLGDTVPCLTGGYYNKFSSMIFISSYRQNPVQFLIIFMSAFFLVHFTQNSHLICCHVTYAADEELLNNLRTNHDINVMII